MSLNSESIIFTVIGFAGGIFVTFMQGWVGVYFKERENKKSRTQKIIDQLSEVLSNTIGRDWTDLENNPNKYHSYVFKSEHQLRALGHSRLADLLKEFLQLWYTMTEYGFDLSIEEYSGISLSPEQREEYNRNDNRIRDIVKQIIVFKA